MDQRSRRLCKGGLAPGDLRPLQSLDGQTDSTPKRVATLTVTDWASVETSGSYIFRFVLQGNWSMKVQNDEIVYTNKDDPKKKQSPLAGIALWWGRCPRV